MFWIDFSRTGIGPVEMLPAQQSLNKDFFAGTVLLRVLEDRELARPNLKAHGTFSILTKHHLTSPPRNVTSIESREYFIRCPVQIWLRATFGYSDI
jgi:hypothetical protein